MHYRVDEAADSRGFPVFREAVTLASSINFMDAMRPVREAGFADAISSAVSGQFPDGWYWNDYSGEGIPRQPLGDACGTFARSLNVTARAKSLLVAAFPDLERVAIERMIGSERIYCIYIPFAGECLYADIPLARYANPAHIGCDDRFKHAWESHHLTGLVFSPVE